MTTWTERSELENAPAIGAGAAPAPVDPGWAWAPYAPEAERPWTLKYAGHLYRRAAFGANWQQLEQALAEGPQRTVDRLVRPAEDASAAAAAVNAGGRGTEGSGNIESPNPRALIVPLTTWPHLWVIFTTTGRSMQVPSGFMAGDLPPRWRGVKWRLWMAKTIRIETARVFRPLLDPARYKGAFGGRGSGKSRAFAAMLIERCLAKATRAVCVLEFQRTLEQSLKRLLEDLIGLYELGGLFRELNTHIETPGGGIIIFQGMQSHTAESISRWKGMT